MPWELIENIKNLIEIIVLIGGFTFGIIQIRLFNKQLKNTNDTIEKQTNWNRSAATYEYIQKYSKVLEANKTVLNLKVVGQDENTMSEISLEKKLKRNVEFRSNIMDLVSYFENLAIGIINEYFDEQIAKSSLGIMTIKTYEKLDVYFNIRKKELGRPIAQNFQELYNMWKNDYEGSLNTTNPEKKL